MSWGIFLTRIYIMPTMTHREMEFDTSVAKLLTNCHMLDALAFWFTDTISFT